DVRPGEGTATRHGRTTVYIPKETRGDEFVRGDESVTGDKDGRQGVTSLSPRTSHRTSKRERPTEDAPPEGEEQEPSTLISPPPCVTSREWAARFWERWPTHKRKSGEEAVKRKAAALIDAGEVSGEDLMRATELACTDPDNVKHDRKFMPGPLPFLNQRKYE